MTSTSAPDATTRPSRGGPRRARSTRRRRRWTLVLLLALVALAVFVVWLGTGLLSASRTVQDKAGVAQDELQAFRTTLKDGDRAAAAKHLANGRTELADAKGAAGRSQVRIAKHLPWVGSTVSDLDHLLAAADIMTRSGGDALKVYEDFSGADSKLFNAGKFSLPAIARARQSVAAISASMDRAQHELEQVHGDGPKGAQALQKKRSALAQIASLRTDIVSLAPLLESLPAAVGGNGTKTYLVAIMNPAEMRPSGGAPLSVAFVRFRAGRLSIPTQGTTSELTGGNRLTQWTKVPGDPWQFAGAPQRFVNANFNPDFPVSAEQMARAAKPSFGIKVDGVVALDIVAISDLLRETGPIESQDYGTLTADNVATKLVINAYKTQGSDASGRHDANEQLMSIMLSRLTQGGGLIGKAKALGQAVPGRHLQMYFRDARLQQLMSDKHFAGAVPRGDVGNLSATYTQNTNASKMDVFQRRSVKEVVQVREDGSAEVTRTVTLHNASPRYLGTGTDPGSGYDTRWAGQLVIAMLPRGARITKAPSATGSFSTATNAVQVRSVKSGEDQAGRAYGQAQVLLPPGATGQVSWTYVVPHATVRHGDALRLLDYVAPQSMLTAPSFALEVHAPAGWHVAWAGPGWTVHGGVASVATTTDRSSVLKVQVAPKG